jgi:hypothetical protein
MEGKGNNVPSLSRNSRRSTTPYPGLAEKHNLLVQRGFRKVKFVQELFFAQQQRVGLRGDRDIDRGGNAVLGEFVRLAHVDEEAGRGGRFEDGEDLGRL